MKEFKTMGIVISEMPIKEKDKRIVIYTKEHGKLACFAKGARKPKSTLLSGTQLLSYGEYVISKFGNSYQVKQVDLIENFYNIRNDIKSLAYTMYMLEVLDFLSLEGDYNPILLKLILKTLTAVKSEKMPIRLIVHIFRLKIMALCGYMPNVKKCTVCGADTSFYKFSVKRGGVVCDRCTTKDSYILISDSTIYTITYILSADINKLYSFNLSDKVLDELERITDKYVQYHLDKKFKTLHFIEQVKDL